MNMEETLNREAAATSPFTAQEAAVTLSHLEGYEEILTTRAFAVTLMAFAVAGGATTMTYAYAADWFVAAGVPWLLSFLWLPWIGSAGLLTSIVWRTQAVTLGDHGQERGSWGYFVLFSLLYMALLGGITWADLRWDLGIGHANHNLLTLGVFTALIALVFQLRHGFGWMLGTLYFASGLLVVLALVYALLPLAPIPATLAAVFTGLFVWVIAGAFIAARG